MKDFTFLKGVSAALIVSFFGGVNVYAEKSEMKVVRSQNDKETLAKEVSKIKTRDGSEPIFTEVIMEAEGRVQNYLRYGSGYVSLWGKIYEYTEETDPSPSSILYGSDGKTVYFKDVMDFGWDSYSKGVLEGNKITVELPQTLCIETYEWAEEPYYLNLCVLNQTGFDSDLNFEIDDSITEVTYTVNEDGTITLDALPEGKALGIMTYFIGKIYDDPEDEDSDYTLDWISYWDGTADFTQKFVALDVELVEMPKGIEPITYYCALEGYNYPVSVAFDGDDMYIQGLCDSPYMSNFVVKATVDGDKAYITQDQYVGVLTLDNEMIITKCGYLKDRDITYVDNVNFEFKIDKDRKFLEAAEKDLYLCFAYMNQYDKKGQNGLVNYLNNFYIIYQDSYPGIPSNPFNLFYHDDFYADYGYHSFGFQLTAISTTNNILLAGDLYYSIYVDGELELFEYEQAEPYSHYYMLPEPTTEIPFMFSNENDLDIYTPTERQVGLYYEGMTTIGVQAIYYCGDTRTTSDIVTLNLETGEIETTPAGIESLSLSGNVISSEYFDLSGRKVSNPQNGVFIKKSVLDNGQVKTTKILKR